MEIKFSDGVHEVACENIESFVSDVKQRGMQKSVLSRLADVKQKKNTGIRGQINSGVYNCCIASKENNTVLSVADAATSMDEVVARIAKILAGIEYGVA